MIDRSGYKIKRSGEYIFFSIGDYVYIKNIRGEWSKGVLNAIYEDTVSIGFQRQSYIFSFTEVFSLDEIRNIKIDKIIK